MVSYDPDRLLKDNLQKLVEGIRPHSEIYAGIARAIQDQASYIASGYASQVEEAYQAIKKQDQIDKLKTVVWFENDAVQAMIRQQAELDDMVRRLVGSNAELYSAKQCFAESLVSTEALLTTNRIREEFLALAVQPQLAFQDFERQQLKLAATASEVVKSNRLTLIDAAAGLLGGMNKGIELGALMYPVSSIEAESPFEEPGFTPAVNVYDELTLELKKVDLEDEDVNIEGVVIESRPARVTQLGARLVRLVHDFNVEAEREGKPNIFKPTSKTMLTCGTITARVATDELSFNNIIDDLYFLLYEGSGDAKRLTERYSRGQLEALWRLKSLRRGARHDVNHGTDKEILRQNYQIGEAYRSLIGMVMPRLRTDWANAQIALYRQLVEMLETIWAIDEERDAG
jgi:hypothetical protein